VTDARFALTADAVSGDQRTRFRPGAHASDRFRLLTGGARTALPRQQTLRAVVEWSYDLLFEDEPRLFARLAVFSGGCELAAAEAVCGDDEVPTGEILDVVSRLVDKSLVTTIDGAGETRFIQLQTLWQYGRERFDESDEVDASALAMAPITARWRSRPTRVCGAPVDRCGAIVSSRRRATCAPPSTGSSPPAMLTRR
jgi:predicted ATPase